MTQSKIEEVALAISGAPFPTKASLRKARAAIKAMSEPTDAMLKAGAIPTREIALGNGTVTTGLGLGANPGTIWFRMIDAALNEENSA